MTHPDYDGYCGEAGTRNPEEPASAAYVPDTIGACDRYNGIYTAGDEGNVIVNYSASGPAFYADRIPVTLKADLIALLAYNWQDEERDYYAQDEAEDQQHHIFKVMQRLNVWATGLG
jgi:hypothetical protein